MNWTTVQISARDEIENPVIYGGRKCAVANLMLLKYDHYYQ